MTSEKDGATLVSQGASVSPSGESQPGGAMEIDETSQLAWLLPHSRSSLANMSSHLV